MALRQLWSVFRAPLLSDLGEAGGGRVGQVQSGVITPSSIGNQRRAFRSQRDSDIIRQHSLRKVDLSIPQSRELLLSTSRVPTRTFATKPGLAIRVFEYDTLQGDIDGSPTIRLLELLPGAEDDAIQCRLNEITLSKTKEIKFESLSYTWGEANDQRSIMCNEKALKVPTNLAEALGALRLSDRSRMLWADAVCINQNDDGEKGQQVQLMRKIYSSSERTLVWLGHRNDRHEQGISKAATLSLEIGLWILQKSISSQGCTTVSVWSSKRNEARILLPFSGEFYIALISMLKRPWFQRAWVVQEVVVSKKVTIVWDHAEYDWDELVGAVRFMTEQHFPPSFLFSLQHIASIEDERRTYQNGTETLLGVLLRHQRCHATDPRDKVYSFSGLVKGIKTRPSVLVSYTDKAPKLYTNLAIQLLQESKSLDILSRPHSISSSGVGQLPS
jgi:hypothetical protein